ncbi:sulfatase-like hydrolase/transferase [Clostridium beijerinckii]|uniref:sulfatase-like hydrolase/transferase n=1 Tax=Clostridium beijerinckii TaxID=1520 RepID=UPI00156E4321|nr:sulfatase-like hydrolase/transferase [Clostridium beijerinckii]NRT71438.1 arylsulfatase A-like enzyme [Clostridium beijerinckii]
MPKKPNIIIFNPDQMRADSLAHMGNPAAITPNLDAFARNDAVSFSNAYCQNTVCVPSRCSFLTGMYPHTNGHRTMSYMLNSEETSLLKELKDDGYYVWMNSRNDFLPAQIKGIFDEHATETFYGGEAPSVPGLENPQIRGAIGGENFYSFYNGRLKLDEKGKNYTADDEDIDAAIYRIKNRPKDQPLCIFLGLMYPHPPYQVEEPYFSAIDRKKLKKRILQPVDLMSKASILKGIEEKQNLQSWNEEKWDELRSTYLGMCMKVDAQFGKLCKALKEEGIYDDTAIYVLSDHGDYTGDYGIVEKSQNTFEDCLVNIPLLIKPQKGIEVNPGISKSMVELIDFYATVADLADVKPTHSHFGQSLREVLVEKNKEHRKYVFAEGGRLKGEVHCAEYWNSGENGVSPLNLYYPRLKTQVDDIAHTKATMIRSERYKYVRRLYENDEFYDLGKDPNEINNLINEPEYQGEISKMQLEMLEWYQKTCDIVPFKKDDRFSPEMIWSKLKKICPENKLEELKEFINNGAGFMKCIDWINEQNQNEDNA